MIHSTRLSTVQSMFRCAVFAAALCLCGSAARAQFALQGGPLTGGRNGQGQSVAISADGNTAVSGSPLDNYGAGGILVFTRSNGVWTQQGNELAGTGAVSNASQGWSVAMSADGKTIVEGGYTDSVGGVWVFALTDTGWAQQGNELIGTGGAGSPQQGWSVAISGDGKTIAEGGYTDNSNAGAVWVFTLTDSGWMQQGIKLVGTGAGGGPRGGNTSSLQGTSVTLSADGSTLIEGGSKDSSGRGAVWVFTRADNVWTQQGNKLVGTDPGWTGVAEGTSLAISADGKTFVEGSPTANPHMPINSAGAFWVFVLTDSGWQQQGGALSATGGYADAQQGTAVSISSDGNTIAEGGPFANIDHNNSGAVWVFTRSNGVWSQQGNSYFTTGNDAIAAMEGTSVALAGDRHTLIAGAPGYANYDSAADGAAFVYAGEYVLAAAAGTGGTVNPPDTTYAGWATAQAYTMSPSANYHVDTLIVDGNAVDSTTSYTFNNITGAHSIRAVFSNLWKITASAGLSGSIAPSGTVPVVNDSSQSFSFTPDPGCRVDSIVIDGVSFTPIPSYTFASVTTPHTIRVTFVVPGATRLFTYQPRWNLVSFPFSDTVGVRQTIFPSSSTQAFSYSGGYHGSDTLAQGTGYWLKFPNFDATLLAALPLNRDTIAVTDGWNMIGSVSSSVPVAGIVPLGVTFSGRAWGYSNGYTIADSILPGQGYWIHVAGSGHVVLDDGLLPKSAPKNSTVSGAALMSALSHFNMLTLRDANGNVQQLYLSGTPFDQSAYLLPPVPPAGVFDARFASQSMAEPFISGTGQVQSIKIYLSSAQLPLTVTWTRKEQNTCQFILRDGTGARVNLTDGKTVRINNADLTLDAVPLPKIYALKQNYPNPFNPTTTIEYALPVSAHVSLSIYNLLGQEVATLVNGEQEAGYQSVTVNANNLPSGLYYYRLTAGAFTDVKKMMVVR
ncbi:MAG TPA: T9SS type A sorting domain-containing protein [Bacteroidota bacterium]|nr:T9SS type A sorting domain-containing protein [Bacteroidota bacterium]